MKIMKKKLENKINRIEVLEFIKDLGKDVVEGYVRARKVLSRPRVMAQIQYSMTLRLNFPEEYKTYH